ncbi:hypothetical protein CYLTODRAFT_445663 [Cylindrobasidium torrendii FP15055 ss-10]|uniref:F-box domain-containing protein n=1 Tax=Cylindrobasidium torrendii FP15055 ss-10 TaxID=1314674 RepID=A0A0D7B2X7_9AGAR|nr:hypothetical protein CYLTODRAFT_445663 [Cylindrobasidium torrendii FP15055 ss-10]
MSPSEPPAKRRKASGPKTGTATKEKRSIELKPGRRIRGSKSSALQDLPLDLILEIALNCHPLDLLHLARVSKDLRAVFMTKTTKYVWTAARQKVVDMPAPWGKTSEPEWIHTCFVRICNFCWVKSVRQPTFELNTRLCPSCKDVHAHTHKELQALLEEPTRKNLKELKDLFSLLPRFKRRVLVRDYEEMKQLRAVCNATWNDVKKAKEQELAGFKEHVAQCYAWMVRCNIQKTHEMDDLMLSRQAQIRSKLDELGVGAEWVEESRLEEVDMVWTWRGHSAVQSTNKLTVAGWQKIEAQVLGLVKKVQKRYASREHAIAVNTRQFLVRDRLVQWKETLPDASDSPIPSIADILACQEIRDIVEQHYSVQLTEETVNAAFDNIDSIVVEWRARIFDGLMAITGIEDESNLNLARGPLVCQRCIDCSTLRRHSAPPNITLARPIWPLETFVHPCMHWKFSDSPFECDSWIPLSLVLHDDMIVRTAFNHGPLVRNERMEAFSEMIIRLAGLNPERATVEAMDDLSLLFECKRCTQTSSEDAGDKGISTLLLLDWRFWIEHSFGKHMDDPEIAEASLVMHKYTELVLPAPPEGLNHHFTSMREPRYGCLTCLDEGPERIGGFSMKELITHVRYQHDYEEDEANNMLEGEDFIRKYGFPSRDSESRFGCVFYSSEPTPITSHPGMSYPPPHKVACDRAMEIHGLVLNTMPYD